MTYFSQVGPGGDVLFATSGLLTLVKYAVIGVMVFDTVTAHLKVPGSIKEFRSQNI